ncbi:MAG TPA: Mur ligase domain-containing protein [Candidatus Saccharimonadales bacterium]|nr:Mur ligase domain-containing protein [Candidatus Saccharimonadales bacterium]
MHIFFSGVGGTAIGPLALIAKQAGFTVSGSDKQDSRYIHYLREHGVADIAIGQTRDHIAAVHAREPIDWFVYSSAVAIENPDAPELVFCREQDIKMSKRDELINLILQEKKLKLIAIAGTHGKTTTTAMTIWLFKQLHVPFSYSVGAKMSFGEMGQYEKGSEYFVYEADEFDRNFLAFEPYLSLITGIDWDHPDIYPTREAYNDAFREFLEQSKHIVMWDADITRLDVVPTEHYTVLDEDDPAIAQKLTLPGLVNRLNAWEVAHTVKRITDKPLSELLEILNHFPGVARRFEEIVPNLYTDYAHTPPKIRGALQLAHEVADTNVVVVYEGLHNTRQHFIKDELYHLFDDVKQLYIVPSYLAREDHHLPLLSPRDLQDLLSPEAQAHTHPRELNADLTADIQKHLDAGDTVVCITAGGGGSLDEWLRKQFGTI